MACVYENQINCLTAKQMAATTKTVKSSGNWTFFVSQTIKALQQSAWARNGNSRNNCPETMGQMHCEKTVSTVTYVCTCI